MSTSRGISARTHRKSPPTSLPSRPPSAQRGRGASQIKYIHPRLSLKMCRTVTYRTSYPTLRHRSTTKPQPKTSTNWFKTSKIATSSERSKPSATSVRTDSPSRILRFWRNWWRWTKAHHSIFQTSWVGYQNPWRTTATWISMLPSTEWRHRPWPLRWCKPPSPTSLSWTLCKARI